MLIWPCHLAGWNSYRSVLAILTRKCFQGIGSGREVGIVDYNVEHFGEGSLPWCLSRGQPCFAQSNVQHLFALLFFLCAGRCCVPFIPPSLVSLHMLPSLSPTQSGGQTSFSGVLSGLWNLLVPTSAVTLSSLHQVMTERLPQHEPPPWPWHVGCQACAYGA